MEWSVHLMHENPAYSYSTIYYGDIYRHFNNGNAYQIAGNGNHGLTERVAGSLRFVSIHSTKTIMTLCLVALKISGEQ